MPGGTLMTPGKQQWLLPGRSLNILKPLCQGFRRRVLLQAGAAI